MENIMDYFATYRSFPFLQLSSPRHSLYHIISYNTVRPPVYNKPATAMRAAAPRAGMPVAAAPAWEVEEAMLADEELNLLAEEARLLDAEEPVAVALRQHR